MGRWRSRGCTEAVSRAVLCFAVICRWSFLWALRPPTAALNSEATERIQLLEQDQPLIRLIGLCLGLWPLSRDLSQDFGSERQ